MKNRVGLLALSLFVVVLLIFHVSGIAPIRLLTELEYKAYDVRLRMTMPRGVDPRIVIIDIDENSLSSQGGWPWSREKMAQLTNKLFDTYNIEVLGFDVVFPQANDDDTLVRLRALSETTQISSDVQALIDQGVANNYNDLFRTGLMPMKLSSLPEWSHNFIKYFIK